MYLYLARCRIVQRTAARLASRRQIICLQQLRVRYHQAAEGKASVRIYLVYVLLYLEPITDSQ